MTTLTTALNTTFTPAAGAFIVQCTGGNAQLERRGSSSASWAIVGVVANGLASNIDNPVAAADYRFTGLSGTPSVQADQ